MCIQPPLCTTDTQGTMATSRIVKKRKTLDPIRHASPTLRDDAEQMQPLFAVMSISDFSASASARESEIAAKTIVQESVERDPWDVVDHAVSSVISNMIDMMKECGYDPFYQVSSPAELSVMSDEQLAEHAKNALSTQKSVMEVVSAEFAVRNNFTQAGLSMKYHLTEPLMAEPPKCTAEYHADFLRTPRVDAPWERACIFGSRDQCEAQKISGMSVPAREFLLPRENEALIYAIENDEEPVFPDHPPVCLLCDRRETHIFAIRHEIETPTHKFIDEEHPSGEPELFSAKGHPFTFNTHSVMHGKAGGYRTERLIRAQRGGNVKGLQGDALVYSRSDYIVVDNMEVDGCVWFDQSRLLFPSASIVH